jgi:hypothetical protein
MILGLEVVAHEQLLLMSVTGRKIVQRQIVCASKLERECELNGTITASLLGWNSRHSIPET